MKLLLMVLILFKSFTALALINGTEDHHDRLGILQTINKSEFCKGFLVAPRIVITAAHCKVDTETTKEFVLTDRAGNKKSYSILLAKTPAAYQEGKSGFGFDVSVLILNKKVLEEPTFKKIRLSTTLPELGNAGKVFGGSHFSDQNVDHYKITSAQMTVADLGEISSDHFLLEPVAAEAGLPQLCHGDSGGPFLFQEGDTDYLVGVLSYKRRAFWNSFLKGKSHNSFEYCQKSQGLVTSIPHHIEWLKQTILQLSDQYALDQFLF